MEEISYKLTVPDPYQNAYERVIMDLNQRLRTREMEGIEAALKEHGYVKERTCRMELVKSGPLYDVWHFDCCDKEWSESRCDNGVTDYPGVVCPHCGARVIE